MNAVYLLILFAIVILLHDVNSNTKCPAKNIAGCWCTTISINCRGEYTGKYIPSFRKSNTSYEVNYNTFTYILFT